MKCNVYKDSSVVKDALENIMGIIDRSTPTEFENAKQIIIDLVGNCIFILDKILLDLADDVDDETKKIVDKTKRNLYAMNAMVFSRFDFSKFDDESYGRFRTKMYNWITYYTDKLGDVGRNYYVYDIHDKKATTEPKVALCCIAKLENRYIREFVEYYKKLGINKIFIYDNNDVDGEYFEDVIGDYINSEYVELINVRGYSAYQMIAYTDCYLRHYKEFDYICYFDCDEFLVLKEDKTIQEYLMRPCFKDKELIHINWVIFTDNNKTEYEDKPVTERFKQVKNFVRKGDDFVESDHIKSIIRCSISPLLVQFMNPHTISTLSRACDCEGNDVVNVFHITPGNYKLAQLNHYYSKSMEEFIDGRMAKGRADMNSTITIQYLFDRYFTVNRKTKAKLKRWEELAEKYTTNIEQK